MHFDLDYKNPSCACELVVTVKTFLAFSEKGDDSVKFQASSKGHKRLYELQQQQGHPCSTQAFNEFDEHFPYRVSKLHGCFKI